MPTPTADRAGARLALALSALLACVGLSACSDDEPAPAAVESGYDAVAAQLQAVLDTRAAALRDGDGAAFRATLDRSERTLVREQVDYFDNIEALPVRALSYRLLTDTVAPVEGSGTVASGTDPYDPAAYTGREYWAEVALSLQLDGYDSVPATTRDRVLFRSSADGTSVVIASTTDRAWEEDHPGEEQPWDTGRIRVREADGVLGIFDERTVGSAGEVLDAAARGRRQVRTVLGGDVGGAGGSAGSESADGVDGVVVYVLSDTDVVRELAGRSVGDPDRPDGLTVAMPVDTTRPSAGTASYRVFLNPRVLREPREVIARLVRHELTHALLGPRGGGAPLWLTEGLAEYVSVRPLAPERRRLPAAALSLASRADVLPGPSEFGGPSAEAWYAIAWWACEEVAATYGERTLLVLLDRLAGRVPVDPVLQEVLGIDSGELLSRAVERMRDTYASSGAADPSAPAAAGTPAPFSGDDGAPTGLTDPGPTDVTGATP